MRLSKNWNSKNYCRNPRVDIILKYLEYKNEQKKHTLFLA